MLGFVIDYINGYEFLRSRLVFIGFVTLFLFVCVINYNKIPYFRRRV